VAIVDSEAALAALLTGFAGLVAAAGGILLAVRAVRSRERKAAKAENDELANELATERKRNVALELWAYQMRVLLAQYGLTPPPIPIELDEPRVIEPPPGFKESVKDVLKQKAIEGDFKRPEDDNAD
jgi:hypothetical protein